MSATLFIRSFLLHSSIAILVICFLNYTIDPLNVYGHTFTYVHTGYHRYVNIGIIKTHEFDTAIFGTSTTENFSIDELKKKYNMNAAKLSLNGATAFELNKLMSYVIQHKNIKRIILALDPITSFSEDASYYQSMHKMPLFLYDDTSLNDVPYVTSLDSLIMSYKKFLFLITNDQSIFTKNLDTLYNWHSLNIDNFNSSRVQKSYLSQLSQEPKHTSSQLQANLISNFDQYILPIFTKYKDIEFYIYFPPYTLLYLKLWQKKNILNSILNFRSHVWKNTNDLTNIKLFDFQTHTNITTDYTKYKDLFHFSEDINSYILKHILTSNPTTNLELNHQQILDSLSKLNTDNYIPTQ